MNKRDDELGCALTLGGVIIAAVACFFAYSFGQIDGVEIGRKRLLEEAVKAGHAEYYLDANNERQWRWITK